MLKSKPDHGAEFSGTDRLLTSWDLIQQEPDRLNHPFYFCPDCDEYMLGRPSSRKVNDLFPMSGKRGTEYYCFACQRILGFVGIIA